MLKILNSECFIIVNFLKINVLFKTFHVTYFDNVLFSSPTPLSPIFPPYPSNLCLCACSLSFSLKIPKEEAHIDTCTNKTKTWDLSCVGLPCSVGYTQWHTFGKNLFSLPSRFQLVMGGNLCLLCLLSAGILPGLNLCRTRACCHSLCEFMVFSPVVSWKYCFIGVVHQLWLLGIDPQALRGGVWYRLYS